MWSIWSGFSLRGRREREIELVVKNLLSILVASFILVSAGCGADTGKTASSGKEAVHAGGSEKGEDVTVFSDAKRERFATITLPPRDAQPKIHPSSKAPPKRVVTRDLALGTGPVAHPGDKVSIYYFSVDYETHERKYFRWPPQEALTTRLRGDEPWHRALLGMRAGGWREMIIPEGFFDASSTLDYFVEMVRVNGHGGGRRSKS
jgi:hypothetical protein